MLAKQLESQVSKISVKGKEENESKAVGEKIMVKEKIEVGKVKLYLNHAYYRGGMERNGTVKLR